MKDRTELDRTTRDATRAFLARLSERSDLAGAYLFGSRARGDARADSDADVAVILRGPPGERVEEALRLADLAFEVLLETGVLIEAIPFWEDEWAHAEHFSNPALVENVRREGVRL